MLNIMWKYEINKKTDKFLLWVAYRLPKRLVMWCAIRVINNACLGKYSNQEVPALGALEALNRWDTK